MDARRRNRLIDPDAAEQDRVILIYRHRSGGEDWKDEQYPVRIVRARCNLGGSRAWFLCPAVGCGRRVAMLYGGGIFACRHCYQLELLEEKPHERLDTGTPGAAVGADTHLAAVGESDRSENAAR